MKKTNTKILCLLLMFGSFLIGVKLEAQAVHFTQFDKSGMLINPAETGAYYGTLRVGGSYRDQYRKISSNPYSTALLYLDSPIINVGKKGWLGIGSTIYSDKAGYAELSTNSFGLSTAYHYSIDKDYKNIISIAGSFSYILKSNDLGGGTLLFEDEIDPSGGTTGPNSKDRSTYLKNTSYPDIGLGLLYTSKLSDDMKVSVGSSIAHVNRPSLVYEDKSYKTPMRIHAYAVLNKRFGTNISLSPRLFYAQMGQAKQLQLQAVMGYFVNPDFELKIGGGTRVNDAIQILAGAQFNNIDVGLSYDYNISDLSNPKTGGALELSLSYLFVKDSKPSSSPGFICPQL